MPDLRPVRPYSKPERPDSRPYFRPKGPDGRETDERKSPCVLQDFIPFGAAAQKGLIKPLALIRCLNSAEQDGFKHENLGRRGPTLSLRADSDRRG